MGSNICGNLMPILRIVAYLLKILQWLIPVILIILITFDFVKAMMSSDEKVMEKAKGTVGKRIVYAVIVFVVPFVIRLLFNTLSSSLNASDLNGATSWIKCFNDALNDV